MRASRAVSRLSRWKILCTFVRSQQIFRASQAGVRSWRASSSWMRWPRWSMKKGGTVYAYLRLRHRQAPSLIDKHKQSTPCRGVNFPGLFPLASNWRFSDEGVRTEVQLNVVALRRGRVWFFECGFNRVRQSFLCRPANCSDVARQRQIYCLFGEQHRPGRRKVAPNAASRPHQLSSNAGKAFVLLGGHRAAMYVGAPFMTPCAREGGVCRWAGVGWCSLRPVGARASQVEPLRLAAVVVWVHAGRVNTVSTSAMRRRVSLRAWRVRA